MSTLKPDCVRPAPSGGTVLRVKVVAGASKSKIAGPIGDRLKITLAVPAEKGGANRALELILANALRLTRNSITIASGATSPDKEVLVSGMTPDKVLVKLGEAMEGRRRRRIRR